MTEDEETGLTNDHLLTLMPRAVSSLIEMLDNLPFKMITLTKDAYQTTDGSWTVWAILEDGVAFKYCVNITSWGELIADGF